MEQQSQVVGFKETGANIGLKLPPGHLEALASG